jgi:hypothetical protein
MLPRQEPLLASIRIVEKDVLSRDADFVELTSDDLIDEEGFLGKGLFERGLSCIR